MFVPITELLLPPDTRSPSRARRFATDVMGDEASSNLADTVQLLISEIVTNAVLHARSEIRIEVTCDAQRVRVEVSDRSPMRPATRSFAQQSSTGRGLLLVEELADRWGTAPDDGGKVVWFEVDAAA